MTNQARTGLATMLGFFGAILSLIAIGIILGAIWSTGLNSPTGKTGALGFFLGACLFIVSMTIYPKKGSGNG